MPVATNTSTSEKPDSGLREQLYFSNAVHHYGSRDSTPGQDDVRAWTRDHRPWIGCFRCSYGPIHPARIRSSSTAEMSPTHRAASAVRRCSDGSAGSYRRRETDTTSSHSDRQPNRPRQASRGFRSTRPCGIRRPRWQLNRTRMGWLAETAVSLAVCSSRSTWRAASPSLIASVVDVSNGTPMPAMMTTTAETISTSMSEKPRSFAEEPMSSWS